MHTYTVLISWQIFYLMILTIRCMSKGKLSATQRVSEFFYEWIAMEAHKIHNYKRFSHSRFRMEFKMLIQIKKNSIAIFFHVFLLLNAMRSSRLSALSYYCCNYELFCLSGIHRRRRRFYAVDCSLLIFRIHF